MILNIREVRSIDVDAIPGVFWMEDDLVSG